MKLIYSFPIILSILFYCPSKAWPQFDKAVNTQYATVYFSQDNDLDDFIWKLGGKRAEFGQDRGLAQSRIDRLVNRVQAMLGMWPNNFKVSIDVKRGVLESNKAAYYDEHARTIHISVDYASDGVLAHEIAHAIISQYFPSSVPSKTKEILCQYVDKHLWSDY